MERANKRPHQYLGNLTIASRTYGGIHVYDPRCDSGALASVRANSSAAAAIGIDVVVSSSTVRSTTNNKQKLEAAADRAA